MKVIETYTPGHTENATTFMAARSLATHGQFFARHLTPGLSVLDCGCGPGAITLGIAQTVSPGPVVGVDAGPSQVERATAAAAGVPNASFRVADCYRLPFADGTFDRVFSHALLEHLADPRAAVLEMWRVLKPGGVVGVCSPDWGGFLLAPPTAEVEQAITAYTALQSRNGGDVRVGRKLGVLLASTGFGGVTLSARYECYPSLPLIGDYLATQLDGEGEAAHASTLRAWSRSPDGMFAQAWVSAVGVKG